MLTASIVTHKTPPAQMRKALACLMRSRTERIFIIDNSPSDSLRDALPDDPRIDYRHVENRGFGAGHNLAMRETANSEGYHLVLNADVCWEGDILACLTGYLDSHTDVGLIAPKAFYPDGSLQYNCRMLPAPADLLARRFLPSSLTRRRMERYLLKSHDHTKPLNCPYLLGCFMLFRNEALRDCGLFDERFFMYPEDIDITRRIHTRWKTIYFPDATIIHEHAAASRKSFRMLLVHLFNMALYFNKWGWLRDPQRKAFNRALLRSMATPGKIPGNQ